MSLQTYPRKIQVQIDTTMCVDFTFTRLELAGSFPQHLDGWKFKRQIHKESAQPWSDLTFTSKLQKHKDTEFLLNFTQENSKVYTRHHLDSQPINRSTAQGSKETRAWTVVAARPWACHSHRACRACYLPPHARQCATHEDYQSVHQMPDFQTEPRQSLAQESLCTPMFALFFAGFNSPHFFSSFTALPKQGP